MKGSRKTGSEGSAGYLLVRKFVRVTCNWPVIHSVYRSLYRSAATAVGNLANSDPAIAGIYARNSYALGTWEAGRSDIDLTVVLHHPNCETITRFQARYAELRRRFPMLGEVEMIDERHLDAWTSHGITGWQSQKWIRLGGAHEFRCRYAGSEQLDRVRHATSVYCHQFLKYYWQNPRPEQVLQRAAAKLIRELGGSLTGKHSADELLVICLRELSQAVQNLPAAHVDTWVNYRSLLGKLRKASPDRGKRMNLPDGLLSLIGSMHDSGPRHVLVDDTFAVESIRKAFPGTLIMNPTVFRFYLCNVDPLEYFKLLRDRTILKGQDPLRDLFGLSEDALRDTICHGATNMLTFPYRAEVASLPDEDFRDLLYGWFLRTLRYFEDGKMDFNYHGLRQYFGDRHSEELGRFALLHGIAEELAHHMFAGQLAELAVPANKMESAYEAAIT